MLLREAGELIARAGCEEALRDFRSHVGRVRDAKRAEWTNGRYCTFDLAVESTSVGIVVVSSPRAFHGVYSLRGLIFGVSGF